MIVDTSSQVTTEPAASPVTTETTTTDPEIAAQDPVSGEPSLETSTAQVSHSSKTEELLEQQIRMN